MTFKEDVCMKIVIKIAVVAVIGMLFSVASFAQSNDSEYVVVANKALPGSAINVTALKAVYQREAGSWKHNEAEVVPVDLYLADGFYANLFGKSYIEMQLQWLKMRNHYSKDMPVVARDSASVKKYIAANKDAIGFLKSSDVDDTVKVIKLVN
jgi:hypothetical protein